MGRVAAPFSFHGRTDRRGYWLAFVPIHVVIVGIVWLIATDRVTIPWQLGLPMLAILLAALGANLALGVRRLHDLGRSGGWALAYYAVPGGMLYLAVRTDDPAVSGIALLCMAGLMLMGFFELGLRPGALGPNRYGQDPAGRIDLSAFE